MTIAYRLFLCSIAVRTALILIFLVFGLRLMGKREIGQVNIYDLVLVMLLANAVQNAMTSGAGPVTVGLVSAGTLLVLGRAFTALFVRYPSLERRLVGTPTVIVSQGRLLEDRMRREHITEEQLLDTLRQHGLTDPAQVQLAVLEVDGVISVVPKT